MQQITPLIKQQESLSGTVERVTFHNEENGWSVLKVKSFDRSEELITVIVHQVKVFAGSSLQFLGYWDHHKKFGRQFKAEKIIEKKPSSVAALEKYLGSGLIKGVGPKMAEDMVNRRAMKQIFTPRQEELLTGEKRITPANQSKKLDSLQSRFL